ERVTKGALSGNAGQPAREEFKVNGEYVDTPNQGVVGIPFLDAYVEKAATDYLDKAAKTSQPFFMSVNFMKVHQPNLPHPDFVHKSLSKSKYADSIVEADARIGHLMDKLRSLGLDKNTYGDLEISISLLIETGSTVNASESRREQSGIIRRRFRDIKRREQFFEVPINGAIQQGRAGRRGIRRRGRRLRSMVFKNQREAPQVRDRPRA